VARKQANFGSPKTRLLEQNRYRLRSDEVNPGLVDGGDFYEINHQELNMSNEKKVVIVTGASQGIGAGIVDAYRKNGFAVIANSRSIKESTNGDVINIAGDISDRTVAQRVVKTAIDKFGRIDTLINNAGLFIAKPFVEYTQEDFDSVFKVNIGGFFHVTQLALEQMLKRNHGHVVQISTTLIRQALSEVPAGLAYLTKGGLDAVTRGLALEYAKKGIRVNAIAPGLIKTPMHTPASHDFLANLHPMGRMGEVEDIIEAALYLERATFVTGETLNVGGGLPAGR
jgi:NAD(P)-dependent dehydrogenase (short-subunit alcohol dehydrogenase family)